MPSTFVQSTAVNPSQSYLVLSGQEKRLTVEFKNVNDILYDPFSVAITIYKPDATAYITESYSLTSTYVKKTVTGQYYVDITSTIYGEDLGDYQVVWSWRDASGGELFSGIQYVAVTSIRVFGAIPYLRTQIDKARKDVNDEFGEIFAYTDMQLYMYIRGALSEINRVPPLTTLTVTSFPWVDHQQLIIDVATFVALQSQGVLAIDTDATGYSLQGNSFSVDHWSKISSYLGMLSQRIHTSIGHFKMQYLQKAAVRVERGPGYRQQAIFAAAPSGTNFGFPFGFRR